MLHDQIHHKVGIKITSVEAVEDAIVVDKIYLKLDWDASFVVLVCGSVCARFVCW